MWQHDVEWHIALLHLSCSRLGQEHWHLCYVGLRDSRVAKALQKIPVNVALWDIGLSSS